jgi:hypothetical protein
VEDQRNLVCDSVNCYAENKKPPDAASGSGKRHVSQELFPRFSPRQHLVSQLQLSGYPKSHIFRYNETGANAGIEAATRIHQPKKKRLKLRPIHPLTPVQHFYEKYYHNLKRSQAQ